MAERALTPEDRDKIRRLLETADPDNVRLAVSLLEETASDEDVDSILSEDMILMLLTSGNPELFVRTGQLALRVEAVWQRFSESAAEILGRSRRPTIAEKRLTKEIAEQFLADDESVDLCDFMELNDDARPFIRKASAIRKASDVILPAL